MMPALFAKAKAQRSTACHKGDGQQRSLPDCTDDCRPFKKYHTNVKSAPIPGALFLIQN